MKEKTTSGMFRKIVNLARRGVVRVDLTIRGQQGIKPVTISGHFDDIFDRAQEIAEEEGWKHLTYLDIREPSPLIPEGTCEVSQDGRDWLPVDTQQYRREELLRTFLFFRRYSCGQWTVSYINVGDEQVTVGMSEDWNEIIDENTRVGVKPE